MRTIVERVQIFHTAWEAPIHAERVPIASPAFNEGTFLRGLLNWPNQPGQQSALAAVGLITRNLHQLALLLRQPPNRLVVDLEFCQQLHREGSRPRQGRALQHGAWSMDWGPEFMSTETKYDSFEIRVNQHQRTANACFLRVSLPLDSPLPCWEPTGAS